MTREQFLIRHPEFDGQADYSKVDAALADAALQISAAVFGAQYDVAHGHLAAHILTSSPTGESARLQWDTQESIHYRNYLKVRRQCVVGLGVS